MEKQIPALRPIRGRPTATRSADIAAMRAENAERKRSRLQSLITTKEVCSYFGGVHAATLQAWLNDPALGFPRPVKVSRRRFWDPNEIEAFAARKRMAA